MSEYIQEAPVGPNPWEQRNELGLVKALVQTVKAVLVKPTEFFSQLAVKDSLTDPYLFYLCISIPVALINSVVQVAFGVPFNPLGVIFTAVAVAVSIFIMSGIMHVIVLMFGGKGGFLGTFTVLTYATATNIFAIIPIFGAIVGMIWGIVLCIIGYKHVHGLSTVRAVLAYFLIPCIFLFLPLLAAIAIPNFMRTNVASDEARAQAVLQSISTAAEAYATANAGYYPASMYDLTLAEPPYLAEDYCGETFDGYAYSCELTRDGYVVYAAPENRGARTFSISTGSQLDEVSY